MAETSAECGAIPPNVGGPVPCHLEPGHEGQHFSTSGCAGSEIRWTSPAPHEVAPEQECAGCRALWQNRLTCHLHGLRDIDASSVAPRLGCDDCGKPHTHVGSQGFRGCDDHFLSRDPWGQR